MSPTSFRVIRICTFAASLAVLPGVSASAQSPRSQPATLPKELHERGAAPVPVADDHNAEQLRADFEQMMRQYPPSFGEVLKLDPTLMTNDAYLRNYPSLAAFLATHAEIPRDPAFFLNFVHTAREVNDQRDRENYSPGRELARNTLDYLGVAFIVGVIATSLFWLVRTILAHRRWLRSTKLQMDIHNRLMERLSTSADVQAYLESAATNRLLLDMPTAIDADTVHPGGPVNRILWSVQAGIVLAAAGIGLLIGQRYWPDSDNALTIPGVLILAVGIGFVTASAVSYILSVRLGLLESHAASAGDRPSA